jgi:hypothetical protein
MAPRLELFPFRFRDPITGKWIRTRYRAELHEIAKRHAEFEIIGPPEIRDVDMRARYFNPSRNERQATPAIGNLGPILTVAGRGRARRVIVAGTAT